MSRGYIVRLWNKLVVKAGGKLDIYGELNIKAGATVNGLPSVPDAAADVKGVVKQAAAVADAAGTNPTAAEFNALLSALRAAGILAAAASEQENGDGADT